MRSFGGADKHVAGFEDVVDGATVLLGAHGDAALELVEDFFGFVVVVVLAGVGSGDDHDDVVLRLGREVFVADGRLEFVAVLFEPAVEVEYHESKVGNGWVVRSGFGTLLVLCETKYQALFISLH